MNIEQLNQAIAMREAGYALPSIVQKVGVSASTLKLAFNKYHVKKNQTKQQLIDRARQELIDDTTLVDEIKHQIASSVHADIVNSKEVRNAACLLLEQVINGKDDLVKKTRALAAIATSLVACQTISYKALNLEAVRDSVELEDLPALQISGYSDNEMEEIRAKASMTELELAAHESNKEQFEREMFRES